MNRLPAKLPSKFAIKAKKSVTSTTTTDNGNGNSSRSKSLCKSVPDTENPVFTPYSNNRQRIQPLSVTSTMAGYDRKDQVGEGTYGKVIA